MHRALMPPLLRTRTHTHTRTHAHTHTQTHTLCPTKVLPLENKMKKPQHSTRVLVTAMVIITLLYATFSGLGYIAYGNKVEGSITLNLFSLRIGACW